MINHCMIHGVALIEGQCPKCNLGTEPAMDKLNQENQRLLSELELLQAKIEKQDTATGTDLVNAEGIERCKNCELLDLQLEKLRSELDKKQCLGCAGGNCDGCNDRGKALEKAQAEIKDQATRIDTLQAELDAAKDAAVENATPELKLEPETETKPAAKRGRPKKDDKK